MASNDTFNKEKKPPRQRGYKIRKTIDVNGRPSYDKVPRSGYASAFLRLFCLFLAILVLYNVVTGAGYSGYRNAIAVLYAGTESVGSLVETASTGIKTIAEVIGPLFLRMNNFFFNHEKGNEQLTTKDDTGEFAGVLRGRLQYIYTKDGYRVVTVDLMEGEFFGFAVSGDTVVYESNHPAFAVGDKVRARWTFRWILINETTGVKWKGASQDRYFETE